MHNIQLKKLVWKDFSSVIPTTWLPEKCKTLESLIKFTGCQGCRERDERVKIQDQDSF